MLYLLVGWLLKKPSSQNTEIEKLSEKAKRKMHVYKSTAVMLFFKALLGWRKIEEIEIEVYKLKDLDEEYFDIEK